MTFEIQKSNIIYVQADAIVLPANTMLKEGAGVSTAIFEAAGRKELEKALSRYDHMVPGEAVATSAFRMDADYIIHAVVPKWIDGEHDEYGCLSTAYLSALTLADSLECKSIAFPLLSSGHNGFDLELAFEIAAASIEKYQSNSIEKVILVIFGERISDYVREQGYSYSIPPADVEKDKAKKAVVKKVVDAAKIIGLEMLDLAVNMAVDHAKDPEKFEVLVKAGLVIAKQVLEKSKKKPKEEHADSDG